MTEATPEQTPAPTQYDAAAAEAAGSTPTITVLGKQFHLTKKLSASAVIELERSQKEESITSLLDALAKVVKKTEREDFVDLILSEPEDEDKTVGVEELVDIFTDALEKVGGRPLEQ
jgi:hypothetical protein